MFYPKELKYTKDDEWLRYEGDEAYVGITDYAQSELGDLVFVNLPEVGDEVVAGEAFGDVESVKAVAVHCDSRHSIGGSHGMLDLNAELFEAVDCREAVSTLKESCYLGCALCEGSEHDASVRNGFVSGDEDIALQWLSSFFQCYHLRFSQMTKQQLLGVNCVSVFSKYFLGFPATFFIVKFYAQSSAFVLSVVYNTDVLDVDIVVGQKSSDSCQITWLIINLNPDLVNHFVNYVNSEA